ncbi:MAG: benzoate-CoA ligase family protein [Actinomycetota bacterium]
MSAYNASAWLLDRHLDEGRAGHVAIRHRGRDHTYGQVLADVWRAQHAIAALGLAPGDRIAMVVNDEPGFVSWFLGAQRSGLIPIPLSTMLTAGELAPIVADAGATALVTSSAFAPHIAPVAAAAPSLRQSVVIGAEPGVDGVTDDDPGPDGSTDGLSRHRWRDFTDNAEAPVADTTVDSQAFWLYSSGTTGTPKGVMHRHGSLQATAETYAAKVLRTTADDRFLSIAKLFFAYGLGNSLTFPFAVGATTILHDEPPTPPGMIELIENERPSLFFASPGFTAALLDTEPPAAALASVRATVTAGESLPADLQRRFSERFGHPVLDGIGSTEALHIFISNTLEEQSPGASGRPVAGYEAELRSETDAIITEPDTPGFLHVRGPSIADGYWQREEATAAAFDHDWLRTGDVYTCSADGVYTFLGRNNDMIKAGGIWVSPAEVESVLIEHVSVMEAAVVGARNDDGLETTVAFVVPASGHTVDAEVLDVHCRQRMASFKRPRQIHVVDALPKTATGKIRRFQLRAGLDN